MTADKQVEMPADDPLLGFDIRKLAPTKRTVRLCLIQPIDLQCIVATCAAKSIALRFRFLHTQNFLDRSKAAVPPRLL